ncbi:STAS domain-containing protein [Kitasatospora sp. NPDC101176]|uniref:STAS domain-containing protein n=1 Tax=Kitasatospora sp. NPDC101176 TaxID=3364099 RepID=UPI00380C45F5
MPRSAEPPGAGAEEQGPGGLRVTARREGPVRVVSVQGELDRDTADTLRAALAGPGEEDERRIVVDLAGLRFCDSTGLNLLLRARQDTEADGVRLELAGARGVVARLFEITGADTVLRIHPDLDAALGTAGPASESVADPT